MFVLLLLYYVCVLFSIVYLLSFLCSPFSVEPVSRKYQILGRDRRLPDDLRFVGGEVPLATTQNVQERLVSMFGNVRDILTDGGVTFWAVGHTLYGAHLTSGLLPWVDSIELGFFFDAKEHARLIDCRPALQEAGLQLLRRKNSYRISQKGTSFPYVELWLMAEREGEVAVCTPLTELNEPTFRDSYTFRRRNYDIAHVFPLKSGRFEGWGIPLPADPSSCLCTHFGENYQNVDWANTSHLYNARSRALLGTCSETLLSFGSG